MTMPSHGPAMPTSEVILSGHSETIAPDLIPADDQIHGSLDTGKPRSMLARGWEVFAENKPALVGIGIVLMGIPYFFRR